MILQVICTSCDPSLKSIQSSHLDMRYFAYAVLIILSFVQKYFRIRSSELMVKNYPQWPKVNYNGSKRLWNSSECAVWMFADTLIKFPSGWQRRHLVSGAVGGDEGHGAESYRRWGDYQNTLYNPIFRVPSYTWKHLVRWPPDYLIFY